MSSVTEEERGQKGFVLAGQFSAATTAVLCAGLGLGVLLGCGSVAGFFCFDVMARGSHCVSSLTEQPCIYSA